MAKAQYHKNQRVFVKPVGTWALVEHIIPHWTKGLDEPIRVFYDVGLGREFSADELQAEKGIEGLTNQDEEWRISRARNKWQPSEETSAHPFPGTYPVVITGEAEWGGWRVPGSEYALSPARVERQARTIVSAPRLVSILRHLAGWSKASPEEVPDSLLELMRQSREVLGFLDDDSE